MKNRNSGLMLRLWAFTDSVHTRRKVSQENRILGFILVIRFTCSGVTRYVNHTRTLYCIRSLVSFTFFFFLQLGCISLICASLYTVCSTRKAQASNYAKTPSLSLYKFDTQAFALKNIHWSRYVSIFRGYSSVISVLLISRSCDV